MDPGISYQLTPFTALYVGPLWRYVQKWVWLWSWMTPVLTLLHFNWFRGCVQKCFPTIQWPWSLTFGHQNLVSCGTDQDVPLMKISSIFVSNFLSYLVHKQIYKPTNIAYVAEVVNSVNRFNFSYLSHPNLILLNLHRIFTLWYRQHGLPSVGALYKG